MRGLIHLASGLVIGVVGAALLLIGFQSVSRAILRVHYVVVEHQGWVTGEGR